MSSYFVNPPEYWDRYVEEYAKMTPIHGPFTSGVLNLANSLRPFSSATAILDDGCGTGSLMNCLIDDHGAELPSSVRLLASDYSKGMVAYVEKLKNSPDKVSNPLWQRVETHVLDAQDLSPAIPTASLSHVISNLVFMGMDDATKPISAAYNVLEAGGILTFSLLVNPEWIHAWRYAQHLAPKDKVWNLDTPEVWNSNEAIEKAVRDAGFTSVEIKDMEIPLKLNKESLRGFMTSMVDSENPLSVNLFDRPSPEVVKNIIDAIVEGVVKEQGEESIVLKGMMKFVGAKK